MSTTKDTYVDLSKRLQVLVEDQTGGNAKKFAVNAGVGSATFYNYLKKGRLPTADILNNICKTYSVNLNWLVSGIGTKYLGEREEEPPASENPSYNPDDFDSIPMAKAKLSAGDGAFVTSEEMKEYYMFRKDWLSKTVSSSKNAILVEIKGNSMEPTIYNGDAVMIDTGRTRIYEGEMYALRMDDTIMVKRLSHRPGGKIIVISDNKEEYEPYETDRKNIHILAQVVWYARTLVRPHQ